MTTNTADFPVVGDHQLINGIWYSWVTEQVVTEQWLTRKLDNDLAAQKGL